MKKEYVCPICIADVWQGLDADGFWSAHRPHSAALHIRIAIPHSKSVQYTLSISCLHHFARSCCSVSDHFADQIFCYFTFICFLLKFARPGVGENESSKSTPFSSWKPRTISLALKR
jgi:hypothetical protein